MSPTVTYRHFDSSRQKMITLWDIVLPVGTVKYNGPFDREQLSIRLWLNSYECIFHRKLNCQFKPLSMQHSFSELNTDQALIAILSVDSNQLHAVSETYSSVAITCKCSYDPSASSWLQLRPLRTVNKVLIELLRRELRRQYHFLSESHVGIINTLCSICIWRCKRAIDEVRSSAAHLVYLNSLMTIVYIESLDLVRVQSIRWLYWMQRFKWTERLHK